MPITADDFREIALSMHGAVERAHMKHPDFRANGRIFATLHPAGKSGVVKLSAEEQREFIRRHPKVFAPASGAWGRQGWTVVQLAVGDEATVRGAVMLAWEHVIEQPRGRRASTHTSSRVKGRSRRARR